MGFSVLLFRNLRADKILSVLNHSLGLNPLVPYFRRIFSVSATSFSLFTHLLRCISPESLRRENCFVQSLTRTTLLISQRRSNGVLESLSLGFPNSSRRSWNALRHCANLSLEISRWLSRVLMWTSSSAYSLSPWTVYSRSNASSSSSGSIHRKPSV